MSTGMKFPQFSARRSQAWKKPRVQDLFLMIASQHSIDVIHSQVGDDLFPEKIGENGRRRMEHELVLDTMWDSQAEDSDEDYDSLTKKGSNGEAEDPKPAECACAIIEDTTALKCYAAIVEDSINVPEIAKAYELEMSSTNAASAQPSPQWKYAGTQTVYHVQQQNTPPVDSLVTVLLEGGLNVEMAEAEAHDGGRDTVLESNDSARGIIGSADGTTPEIIRDFETTANIEKSMKLNSNKLTKAKNLTNLKLADARHLVTSKTTHQKPSKRPKPLTPLQQEPTKRTRHTRQVSIEKNFHPKFSDEHGDRYGGHAITQEVKETRIAVRILCERNQKYKIEWAVLQDFIDGCESAVFIPCWELMNEKFVTEEIVREWEGWKKRNVRKTNRPPSWNS